MSTITAQRKVARVMAYAQLRARQAALRNDRWARLNWEEVELLVLEAFYGAEPSSYRFRLTTRIVASAVPRQRTQGQVEMMQRPLRKIIGRAPVAVDMRDGRGSVEGYHDVLECGHRQPLRFEFPDEPKHLRRRCAECKPRKNILRFARRVQVCA